jgi:DNA-binding transcriptional ArsR family regulator
MRMSMTKATIKTKAGTEITIESDKETIEYIINAIQRREDMMIHLRTSREIRNKEIHGEQPTNATQMILKLKKQGYFKSERTATEINEALKKEAFHYPITTIYPVLLRLVRKGELGRLKNKEGNWVYVQR